MKLTKILIVQKIKKEIQYQINDKHFYNRYYNFYDKNINLKITKFYTPYAYVIWHKIIDSGKQ